MSKLAAQMYTVREFTNDAAEVAEAFRKIAQIGYTAVQLSGLKHFDVEEVRKAASENGIQIFAYDVGIDDLTKNIKGVIANSLRLGAEYVCLGHFPLNTVADCDLMLGLLREPLIVLKAVGLRFLYHNHDHEFKSDGGIVLLDYLMQNKCGNFWLLLDCYWAQYAGVNPLEAIAKYADIIECLHLKDMTEDKDFAEVFEGIMDYEGILQKARAQGVKWLAVEQDKCKGDPFDSLKISYQNLRKY